MKKIIIAMIALSATVAVAAQNQERGFNVGDTVYVPRSAEYFLTGEHIAPWVYDDAQVIEVVGGIRYPEGVLLQPVNSWFTKESLLWAPDPKPEPQPEPEPEPQPQPQPQPEPQPVVEPEPVVEPAPVVEPEQEPEPEPVVEPKRDHHRIGIGLRGGGATFFQKVDKNLPMIDGRSKLGGMAALDLEYMFLRTLKNNPAVDLGVRTGVSVVAAQGGINAKNLMDNYLVTDNETPCNHIIYSVEATNIKETNCQLMVEIPVLLALRHQSGLIFTTGPKFNVPVLSSYKTSYTNPDITAYFVELGVAERNQVVTGKLTNVAPQADKKLRTNKLNILWDMELGYEFALKNGDGLALSAFIDATLAYFGYETGNYNSHFIQVGAPKAGGPEIKTNSIMNSYGTGMSYLDFGAKLTYYFNLVK